MRAQITAIVLLINILFPPAILAGGLPVKGHIPLEEAFITFQDNQQEIFLRINLLSEVSDATVIFPVPAPVEIDMVSDDILFTYLAEATQPQIQVEERLVWINSPQPNHNDEANSHFGTFNGELVENYQIDQFTASEPDALQQWIEEHEYYLPTRAYSILQTYADQGWSFVTITLQEDRPIDSTLQSIRLTFETEAIVYPMMLSSLVNQPFDIALYVLTDNRVDISSLETQYASPVDQLNPPPPDEIAAYFTASFLTKLGASQIAPTSITSDFVVQPSATNESFKQTIFQTNEVSGWERMSGPILGVAAVVAMNALVIGFALGLSYHMRRLAGPEPEDSE
ncbi:MAG: hypothetical protein GFH27_549285n236 [Chloroflexi bacterium AL-W]|nr:hypothetical protein [Chloroflexi bacterium AL-N1]NOK65748.1 hypothetical protein [Chloroflexi bacterium AL-N10]NOK74311.1 hypothetical protein [Chloroflexi bacterium AL-N5]NOK80781.1 hypothetical protein [Chloroflexi bacterium AL-W]NOK88569.1 hypothetical protein [Chloroflexi bacterium AL-N15]